MREDYFHIYESFFHLQDLNSFQLNFPCSDLDCVKKKTPHFTTFQMVVVCVVTKHWWFGVRRQFSVNKYHPKWEDHNSFLIDNVLKTLC